MDGRRALAEGAALALRKREGGAIPHVIRREIGRGASCIVYDAFYTDNLGDAKPVRIKECYPLGLRLARGEDGSLAADERDRAAFEASKRRMIDAYRRNSALFFAPALTNSISNASDVYEHGGTVYIASAWSNSETLAAHRCESLRECIALLISVGKVLRRIHEAGFLYLDLKPENILILDGSTDLVQLFDFDSMLSMEALREALAGQSPGALRTPCTRGFAPLEQQTGKLWKLGPHSDVYSLGAVLFHQLWGRTPGAFDCAPGASYDFESIRFPGSYPDALYRELTNFLHRALASYAGDRYAAMPEAVEQLERIARLSDPALPWLHSTPIDAPAFFTGREPELAALDALLHRPDQRILSLNGLGGIGKSTLVRSYLAGHRGAYDAVLFLFDSGDPDALLADDRAVSLNTVERFQGEPVEEYLPRKLWALQKLCDEQRVLLALDNFSAAHLERARKIFSLGWKVLLISRERLPEGFCPALRLEELPERELARLFAFYARRELDGAEDFAAFRSIAQSVGGHTLLLELIGRQVALDCLSLPEAAALAREFGFSRLSRSAVDYIRDAQIVQTTVEALLERLLQLDGDSGEARRILKLLSLFDEPGIPAWDFRELVGLKDMNALGALAGGGWLELRREAVSLHPVLRECAQGWPWQGEEGYLSAAEALLQRLYERILPEGWSHDSDRQYPGDSAPLQHWLRLAEQAVENLGILTPAGQRLRYRLAMDAPVDRDECMLERCLALLEQPLYLEPDSVLHLYNQAALLYHRLGRTEEALAALKEMKRCLARHPSALYRSIYHNTLGNLLHDQAPEGNLPRYLKHQDAAIAAARHSRHPEAKRQLATCLMDKAMSLLDRDMKPKRCGRLLDEAGAILRDLGGEYDYERYHWLCISAMYHARVSGDAGRAQELLDEATRIADMARDSALSYADHLVDQCAPIYCALGRFDRAIAALQEAIELCDARAEAAAYRRLRFDARLFLARVCADAGDCIRSEAIYDQLEAERSDSPFPLDEGAPLCPREVRKRAARQRKKA